MRNMTIKKSNPFSISGKAGYFFISFVSDMGR